MTKLCATLAMKPSTWTPRSLQHKGRLITGGTSGLGELLEASGGSSASLDKLLVFN